MTLNISTWEDFETTLQGHKIDMELRKLERGAMVAVLPAIQRATEKMDLSSPGKKKPSKKKDVKEVSAKEIIEYMDVVLDNSDIQDVGAEIFKSHVRNIKGISIDGQPVTPEQLGTESCLVNLAVDIINQLVAISQITKAEVKNSERPSGGAVKG